MRDQTQSTPPTRHLRALQRILGTLICVTAFGCATAGEAAATDYHIDLTGTGTGSVVSTPSGLSCSDTGGSTSGECSSEFPFSFTGPNVELTASPGTSSQFEGWTGTEVGSCSSGATNPCSFAGGFSGESTITADFALVGPQQTLKVQLTGAGSGEVTSSPKGIECGTKCEAEFSEGSTVVLAAKSNAHSTFAGWTGCSSVNAEGKCEVTMSEAKTVEAEFDLIPQQTLKVQKTGSGSGEVTSSPSGISCGGGTCEAEFDEGATVTLTAIPTSESFFAGWSGGGCTGTTRCEVTLNAATTVTATFEPIPPPTASTGGTTTVGQTTATLTGIVDGQGYDTYYVFEYGETASYGSYAPANNGVGENAGVVATNTSETIKVSGLAPNTTYHYKIVAYNVPCSFFCPRSGANTAEGVERTFTTLPLTPAVTTDVPVSVGPNMAVVGGEVIPQGATTSYEVEYGLSEGLGSSTPQTDAGSAATTGVYVVVGLEGLQANTVYYYRITATNSGGTTHGEVHTFTTNASGEPGSGSLPPGFSLTQTGTPLGNPIPLSFPSLATLGPLPPTKLSSPSEPKPLTRAQKLAKALKQCKKDKNKSKRTKCEKAAKAQYGPKTKASKKKK